MADGQIVERLDQNKASNNHLQEVMSPDKKAYTFFHGSSKGEGRLGGQAHN